MGHRSVGYNSLIFLAVSHALVDAVCALMVFWGARTHLIPHSDLVSLVVLYNATAFALQSPLGLALDRWREPGKAVAVSLLLLAVSAAGLRYAPMAAVIVAGLANAVFHVGGGTISFQYSPGRASAPGIFVAPGDIGLVGGILLGKGGSIDPLAAVPVLVLFAMVSLAVRLPKADYGRRKTVPTRYFEAILVLVLLCVAVRSMIGSMVQFPWKANVGLLLTLTMAIVAGKALGGILADRLGWIRVPVAGLLVSAPIIAFCGDIPALAIAGMLLFQFTMPVTLTAIYRMLPGTPGFAFGLASLALMVGSIPDYISMRIPVSGDGALFVSILISAVALFVGLRLFFDGLRQQKREVCDA